MNGEALASHGSADLNHRTAQVGRDLEDHQLPHHQLGCRLLGQLLGQVAHTRNSSCSEMWERTERPSSPGV